jgi:ParB family chromosome partitioning protein
MANPEKIKRPSGLGRGLSSLLGDIAPKPENGDGAAGTAALSIALIDANPKQPRQTFAVEALDELVQSVRLRGVLQPILVRPKPNGRYEIVAGERRWRAAQAAQLHEIPAIVRPLADGEAFEIALIENIQRADLNPIEEAEGYQRLIGDFGHSQEALGRLVGKSRSHVANLIRLLDLPAAVRDHVREGRLTMGHARALITAADPEALAEQVLRRGLSVRQTEELARSSKEPPVETKAAKGSAIDSDLAALQRQLSDVLGLKVTIAHTDRGGNITIDYSTLDQLDMLCQRLSGELF